jgi:hypothetical protein
MTFSMSRFRNPPASDRSAASREELSGTKLTVLFFLDDHGRAECEKLGGAGTDE